MVGGRVMNLQEYKEKEYFLYDKFCKVVKRILKSIISPDKFDLQQIQCRTKDPDSLEKKLKERGVADSNEIEDEVDDIAGCRLIFYYNNDVDKLTDSSIIRNNFDVIERKIHNNVDAEAESANEYYIADHYIVELTPKRLSLPEFKKFEGMRCEIQIQTVLNHAYSETTHDITYKPPKFPGFGSRALKSIGKRFKDTMRDYLIPAGINFQRIKKDYQLLVEGKTIYETNVLEDLINCSNNNERHSILRRYRIAVLPYLDDYKKAGNQIFDIAIKGIELSRIDKNVINIGTEYGVVDGRISYEVFKVCIEILESMSYLYTPRLLGVLFEIFRSSVSEEEREKITEFIDKLSAYDTEMLNKIGLSTQTTLINLVKKYSDDKLKTHSELIIAIASAVLKPYAEGLRRKSGSMMVMSGSLQATRELIDIRENAIKILMRLYQSRQDNELFPIISNAMLESTKMPTLGNYSDDLQKIILENTLSYIEFVKSAWLGARFDYLVSLEEKIEELYVRSRSIFEKDCSDGELTELNTLIIAKSEEFRDLVNSNERYIAYKCLVDWKLVFAEDWGHRRSHDERKAFREKKGDEYIKDISINNFEERKNDLEKFCETKSDDRFMFEYLYEFSELLAQKKPDIAIKLIEESGDKIAKMLPHLLNGLLLSSNVDYEFVRTKMREDIAKSGNLRVYARLSILNTEITIDMLESLLNKSLKTNDRHMVKLVIFAVADTASSHTDAEISSIFIPAIEYLTEKKDASWIYEINSWGDSGLPIQKPKSKHVDIVLKNLFYLRDVDFRAESTLKWIAEKYPSKLIRWFKLRLEYKASGDAPPEYLAIPYKFYKLHNGLSKHLDICIDGILSWHDPCGADLIKNIFPEFSPELKKKLKAIVETSDANSIEVIVKVLQAYQDQDFLPNMPSICHVCLSIVKALDEGHPLLREIKKIPEDNWSSFSSDELTNLYQATIKEVERWKSTKDEKIIGFAKLYTKELEIRMKRWRSFYDKLDK